MQNTSFCLKRWQINHRIGMKLHKISIILRTSKTEYVKRSFIIFTDSNFNNLIWFVKLDAASVINFNKVHNLKQN